MQMRGCEMQQMMQGETDEEWADGGGDSEERRYDSSEVHMRSRTCTARHSADTSAETVTFKTHRRRSECAKE